MNDNRILHAGWCLVTTILLLLAAVYLIDVAWQISVAAVAIALILTDLAVIQLHDYSKEQDTKNTRMLMDASPEVKLAELDWKKMQELRMMDKATLKELQNWRISLVLEITSEGPIPYYEMDGVKIPKQFVIYYLQCASQDKLTSTNSWSDGELWDNRNPNSPTMRYLAEFVKRFLAMRRLVEPSAGPQKAQVNSWPKICYMFGLSMEEIEK